MIFPLLISLFFCIFCISMLSIVSSEGQPGECSLVPHAPVSVYVLMPLMRARNSY